MQPVLQALKSKRRERIEELRMLDSIDRSERKDARAIDAIVDLAQQQGVKLVECDRGELNTLTKNKPHQGFALVASPLEPEALAAAPAIGDAGDVWLCLDEVQDPQNLGALLRSARFLGAKGVAVAAKNSAPLSPAVSKASAGALEDMDVHAVSNMPRFLGKCVDAGWRVVAADASGFPLGAYPAKEAPTIVVMGSEGAGLRPMVRNACAGGLVKVDGVGDDVVDSLNVSVSGAICLWHFLAGGSGAE